MVENISEFSGGVDGGVVGGEPLSQYESHLVLVLGGANEGFAILLLRLMDLPKPRPMRLKLNA